MKGLRVPITEIASRTRTPRVINRALIGGSQKMVDLRNEIARLAEVKTKVLVTGESGVGKELVASAICQASPRAVNEFIVVNCAGLTETLLESELFGHTQGSFTGAIRDKAGKLELADQGTVFLDEVGEMSPRMQGLLLRFLETGELQKVGSDRFCDPVDVRVIAATNRDLPAMVRRGSFREDLYYRLRVIELRVPALRERKEDMPELIAHFMDRFAPMSTSGPRRISDAAMRLLSEHRWPGNVRELENVLERLVVTTRRPVIDVDDLPPEIVAPRAGSHSRQERRRTTADDLYRSLTVDGKCFWTTVYPLFMQREITRNNVRELVRKGLHESCGSYRVVARMFNMDDGDYKRFLNFLRKHHCQVPFREYRLSSGAQ